MQEPQPACSFCGKPRSKVRDLITRRRSSTAYICDACLDVCRKILDDPKQAEPPPKVRHCVNRQGDPTRLSGTLYCSFCGTSQDDVSKLISSRPGKTYICDGCVRTALKILDTADEPDLPAPTGVANWLKQKLGARPARLHRMR